MSIPSGSPVGSFYDFGGLQQLRADAASNNSASAGRKAANEFEAAFMQMMLQSMKQASGLNHSVYGSPLSGHS